MQVHNVHEREFDLSLASVGSLIDSLASSNDRLWPNDKWPPTRFDRALAVGARGGHEPIRYSIEEYYPGNKEGHIPTRSASEGPMKSSESRRGSPLDD